MASEFRSWQALPHQQMPHHGKVQQTLASHSVTAPTLYAAGSEKQNCKNAAEAWLYKCIHPMLIHRGWVLWGHPWVLLGRAGLLGQAIFSRPFDWLYHFCTKTVFLYTPFRFRIQFFVLKVKKSIPKWSKGAKKKYIYKKFFYKAVHPKWMIWPQLCTYIQSPWKDCWGR